MHALTKGECLGRCPLDRNLCMGSRYNVLLLFTRHSKVRNLDHFILVHQAVTSSKVSVKNRTQKKMHKLIFGISGISCHRNAIFFNVNDKRNKFEYRLPKKYNRLSVLKPKNWTNVHL